MQRRAFLVLALCACAQPSVAQPASGQSTPPATGLQPSDLLGASGDPSFLAWLNDFYGRALAAGWSRSLLDGALSGLFPDPRVLVHNATQPEFARPISAYVEAAASPAVAAMGRRERASTGGLDKIEADYGVPADILVAIWGMESAFGATQGSLDVVRSLATLAASDPKRRSWAEGELFACLSILKSGAATRAQLKGSWAGAMGQTQLLPSTYLSTAVKASGEGSPDIWSSPSDALASAANLLAKAGWRRGQGWAREVRAPADFDFSLTEGPKQPPAWWADKGVRPADRLPWSDADAAAQAQLIVPAGADGPAFLLFPNHFVIRAYNNSLAYALSVGLLADRLSGRGLLVKPWPVETPLSLSDRMDAQAALTELGFNPGPIDGLIGTGVRQALRAWQKARGLRADGYLSPALVRRLKAEAAAAAKS
jgi:lytic murein transglycosylase